MKINLLKQLREKSNKKYYMREIFNNGGFEVVQTGCGERLNEINVCFYSENKSFTIAVYNQLKRDFILDNYSKIKSHRILRLIYKKFKRLYFQLLNLIK